MSSWIDDTIRFGQVNFNEEDPETLDVDWWVAYWKRTGIQSITLGAGGGLAFYPTQIEGHPRSPWLGDRDLLGDTVRAAKSLGLKVIARLDTVHGPADLRERHPDWLITTADGEVLHIFEGFTPRPCHNGPYFTEFLPAIVTEVLTNYDVDGFFSNAFPQVFALGLSARPIACHCASCLTRWEATGGGPLPPTPDPLSDDWWRYVEFQQRGVEEAQARLQAHTKALKPSATFIPSAFVNLGEVLDWDRWIESIDALGSDAQTRHTHATPYGQGNLWSPGLEGEMLRAVARGKPVINFCAVYDAGPPSMRSASMPPAETGIVRTSMLAHGARPKWHTLGGKSHDRRWMDRAAELDQWMASVDPYLHNTDSPVDVAILWSPRSVHLAAWKAGGVQPDRAIRGWYSALTEARIPVELLHENQLETLDRYAVVILPSGVALPTASIERLAAFRAGGGGIVAACGAGMCDELGRPHPEPLVRSLLGHGLEAAIDGPHPHCYTRGVEGPLFEGIGDTDVLGGATWRVAPVGASTAGGAWVPDFPTGPTHSVRMPPADETISVYAWADRYAYLGMDVDAFYDEHLRPDHYALLVNAVRHARGGKPLPVDVSGDGFVEVRPWRQAASRTVFLVNLDTPSMYRGATKGPRPLGPQLVRMVVPEEIANITLLRAGTSAIWSRAGDGVVVVEVPVVADFEVVAVDLR